MTMRNTRHSWRSRSAGGFTLIELLVVISILGILLTLGTGGALHMLKQADIKKTMATQKVIIEAVHAYHGNMAKWPEVTAGNGAAADLLSILWGNAASKEVLQNLPEGAIQSNSTPLKSFFDAFGNEMYYLPQGGLGGAPRLVSAGPDGNMGAGSNGIPCDSDDSTQLKLNKDNILSDEGK